MPLSRALLWIFLSVFLTLAVGGGIVFFMRHLQDQRVHDDTYAITAILQTGPEKEALATSYLAEWLELSADKKTNLHVFNAERAQKRLKSIPVIKRARVKKIPPDTVYIDYTVRTPVAILYDYTNTGIDQAGYIFPLHPFFTPKCLPEVYLGLLPFGTKEDEFGRCGACWNTPMTSKEAKLALNIVETLSLSPFQLLRVDVSRAYYESAGQRQVVLVIEDVARRQEGGQETTYIYPRILRLNTENYQEGIDRYLKLRKKLNVTPPSLENRVKERGVIIDLRLEDVGFLWKN